MDRKRIRNDLVGDEIAFHTVLRTIIRFKPRHERRAVAGGVRQDRH